MEDSAAEFSQQRLSGRRGREKTSMQGDGHTGRRANDCGREGGGASVFAGETKRKKNETKKPRAQVAGRDYGHS
mgnify:CR=1 FL=1